MSLSRKFSASMGAAAALTLLAALLPAAFGKASWLPVLLTAALPLLLLAWIWHYFRKRLLQPFGECSRFLRELTAGKNSAPLEIASDRAPEIREFQRLLLQLRDRQQNLDGRLRLSYSREQEARRQGEHGGKSIKYRLLARWVAELGDPLSNIDGFAMLMNPAPTPERQSWLDGIRRGVVEIHRQLKRMLEVCDLGEARRPYDDTPFPIGEFLRQLLEFNSFALQERGVELGTRIEPGAPDQLCTDRDMLFEVINILIRAAGRAAAPGERVAVRYALENGQVLFQVCDERRKPQLNDLVDEYRNCHSGAEAVDPDVAVLGLMFVESQASVLGCRLTVTATPDSNTVLSLEFPASDLAPEIDVFPSRSGRAAWTGRSEAPEIPSVAGTLRVLLADPDRECRRIFEAFSGRAGLEYVTAGTLEEALRALKSGGFDAVLVSTLLNRGNITETLNALCKIPAEKFSGRILVLASGLTTPRQRRLFDAGADGVLYKPLNFADLPVELRRRCGVRRHE